MGQRKLEEKGTSPNIMGSVDDFYSALKQAEQKAQHAVEPDYLEIN